MRNKVSIFIFLTILLASFIFMSADQSPSQLTIQQLMEAEIEKKLQKYIDIRNKKCNQSILKEASQRADSIIIASAKSMKVIQDTIQRPLAPDRPDRPELLTPIDSSFPIPLLDSDSLILIDSISDKQ